MPKNVQTTIQLHSFHIILIVRLYSKSFKPGFSSSWTKKFQMYKLGTEKKGTRDQIANIQQIIKNAREFQKIMYFCFTDYAKAFDCVDHNKLWKILKEMGVPDHLTCLLKICMWSNTEATVKTGHGTMNWFQIWKGVHLGCILSLCLFNFYAEYIMQNARLDEAQAGIKISRKNINSLRYEDDTTLMKKLKRNWRASWRGWKKRVEKLVWNSTRKKSKTACGPIISW